MNLQKVIDTSNSRKKKIYFKILRYVFIALLTFLVCMFLVFLGVWKGRTHKEYYSFVNYRHLENSPYPSFVSLTGLIDLIPKKAKNIEICFQQYLREIRVSYSIEKPDLYEFCRINSIKFKNININYPSIKKIDGTYLRKINLIYVDINSWKKSNQYNFKLLYDPSEKTSYINIIAVD